ncbi:MAG: enolase C-terminal domain-like protein [Acidobacteriota bacterium]
MARIWMREGGGPIRAIGNARRAWSERRGLLVVVEDADGLRGVGEASPLPGYSPDSLDAVRAALAAWSRRPLGLEASDALRSAVLASESIPPGLPSARFAAETACLDLLARRSGRPMHALLAARLGTRVADAVPVAALGTLDDLEAAEALIARGVTTLKLKIGRSGRFSDELEALRRLRSEFGGGIDLRLDANGVWTAGEARSRLADLASIRPALVEEPTNDWAGLLASPDLPDVPLALDESLQRCADPADVRPWLDHPCVSAVVVKPTTLGGLGAGLRWIEAARAAGLEIVVSHCFEGPVAFAALRALALACGPTASAAGLGRHAGLDAWPAVDLGGAIGPIHAADLPGTGLTDDAVERLLAAGR